MMKDFDIDLQLFAEEEEQTTKPEPAQTEDPVAKQEEPAQEEEIPQELDGLPEDAAREAMEEAAKMEPPAPAESENSDNKPSEGDPVNTTVPYPRFKEQVDKVNGMEAQLAAYRAKYGDLNDQPAATPQQTEQPKPAPAQTPAPAAQTQPTQPTAGFTPQFTPEISAKIDEAVNQKALQMTGMTAEDAAALEEYGDDDSPKLKMLENAKSMARQMIIGEITEAVRQQQAQRAAYIRQHQSMIDDYNAFVKTETAEPDFAEVQAYAVGDYFNKCPEAEQAVLRDAYARIEGQMASPQDIMLIKRYFSEAKAAFRGGKQQPAKAPAPAKRAARPTLPRASEVDGSASAPAEGITNESLAKMLEEMDPDEIPEQYRKLLMG